MAVGVGGAVVGAGLWARLAERFLEVMGGLDLPWLKDRRCGLMCGKAGVCIDGCC